MTSSCLVITSGSLTHGGDHVSRGALVVGEPERRLLRGCENDKRLGEGAKGLTQHHQREQEAHFIQRPAETQHGTGHVEPRAQNQLKSKGKVIGGHVQRRRRHGLGWGRVCTVIRSPRVSNIHVVTKLTGMDTTMKTSDNQLTSSRVTCRYWEDWSATGAKVSHIWGHMER